MNNKKHFVFIGAILAIVLVVGGLIYQQEDILRNGDSVILATRPVDPRDLFRGEYVILRYEIESDEKIEQLIKDQKINNGEKIYIKLSDDLNPISYVVEARKEKPESFEDLWIVGEVNGVGVRFPSLEQFYVPEGAGPSVEMMGSDLHVKVILKNSESRISQLLDGNLDDIDVNLFLE